MTGGPTMNRPSALTMLRPAAGPVVAIRPSRSGALRSGALSC